MAVPKRKKSKSKRDMRRAHDKHRAADPAKCPQCGAARMQHHACPECGNYDGRKVFEGK
ncbi:50S ribosomal protein L32 [Candidatus Desulfarcum epimagneticum]|uniref:Large ribosomal subunit protein bL32 n=1 Tax=uncultured Desulfobacteraceae bacterium TaxID=218296 RepID=A0A484HKC8_9BACT|nr:50S ribosomal protein L32 [uncultured Desulfobacteraceae bacterium]